MEYKKVKDMSYMFSGCTSLKSLPDISNWNIDNVTNLSDMFSNCESLQSLPDISIWNTSKANDISFSKIRKFNSFNIFTSRKHITTIC